MNMLVFPRIQCNDGFNLSVQARAFCYCSPRNDEGPWTAVEVGFPSEREELLMEWAEDSGRPTDTVYGWVPVEVVNEVIAKHGGTNEDGAAVLNAIINGGAFLDRFRV
tara:strand:- start:295 stop:618 length:324 start_codon:yes stop_codon:yes gene_type:complete